MKVAVSTQQTTEAFEKLGRFRVENVESITGNNLSGIRSRPYRKRALERIP
jgi:hypothetical protein